jgi:hypothetical protein
MAMALFPFYKRSRNCPGELDISEYVHLPHVRILRKGTYAGLGLEDRVHTHDGGSGSRDDPVGQFSISAEENMTGQLSNGNIIGRLLKLQDLLVHAH